MGRSSSGSGRGGDVVLEADEIVFSDKKSPPSPGSEEETEGGQELSEEELRSIWLRQVQTKPADFLRNRFPQIHQRCAELNIDITSQPMEVARIVRSFDPCLACASHVYGPDGRQLAEVVVR